jgi:hypothetical protein
MKGVMSTSLLFTIMAVSAGAQEAMPIAQSDADQTAPTAQQGVSLIDHWRMATPADPATNAVTLPGPTQNGYGSGDYGGCVEIFPSGYNVTGKRRGRSGIRPSVPSEFAEFCQGALRLQPQFAQVHDWQCGLFHSVVLF